MKSALCTIFLVYFLTFNIDAGSALRCYSCVSQTGQRQPCEVRPTSQPAPYCSYGYTSCMTLVIGYQITRACAQPDVCSFYYNTPGFRSCSICPYELCNSGFTPSYANSLVLFTFLCSIIKYFQ